MFKKIKKLIEDFNEFRLVRRMCSYSELSSSHKAMVLSYNKEFEKEMNNLVLKNLYQEMLDSNVSAEYVKWFRSALTSRFSYLSYTNKFK